MVQHTKDSTMRKLLALSILALAASPLTAMAAPIGGAQQLLNRAVELGTQQDASATLVREGSSRRRNHGVRGASLDDAAVQDAPIVLVREASSGGGRQRRNRGVRGVSLDNTVIQDAPIVLVREGSSGGGRQRRNHGVRGA